jgi:hypothetical protein
LLSCLGRTQNNEIFTSKHDFSQQDAYIRFVKVKTSVHTPGIIAIDHWITNSSNLNIGVISHNASFLQDVEKETQKITLFRASSDTDFNLMLSFFTIAIDTCKFLNGKSEVRSLYSRMVSQDYLNSLSSNVTCPFKKGTNVLSINNTYNDGLLPPIPKEIRVRLEKIAYGYIKKSKKLIKMYTMQLHVLVKK